MTSSSLYNWIKGYGPDSKNIGSLKNIPTELSKKASMRRRVNCNDNAVAESFFKLLKRERIKRKIYTTRERARADIFDYIEMIYNSRRKHGEANNMSPLAYEKLEEFK